MLAKSRAAVASRRAGSGASAKKGRRGRSAEDGQWVQALGGFPRELPAAAAVAIENVLRVKRGERVVIVTNPEPDVLRISAALMDASVALGARASVLVQPRKTSLDMADDAIIYALRSEPEVIISISAAKLGKDRFGLERPYVFKGHPGKWSGIFDALIGAKKARSFWSPAVTLDSFVRTVPIDYALLSRRARLLKTALDRAARVHITSPGGTDLEIGVAGRKAHLDDGAFWKPGTGGNLPAGEAYISPANYDGEGVVVFDGSLSVAEGGAFVPRQPVTVEIRGGRAVKVHGGAGAKRFQASLTAGEEMARRMKGKKGWPTRRIATYERNARHIGELGIGLNPAARVTGNMLEDEKILGTCHLALGANYDLDAEAFTHLDCIVRKPTITLLDAHGRGREVMRRGQLVF
jgi:aminopeptidase